MSLSQRLANRYSYVRTEFDAGRKCEVFEPHPIITQTECHAHFSSVVDISEEVVLESGACSHDVNSQGEVLAQHRALAYGRRPRFSYSPHLEA